MIFALTVMRHTLDFSLSAEEKTFLLSQGRLAALRFLLRKGHIERSEVDAAIERAEQHRAAALIARKKRTFRPRVMRWGLLAIFVLVLLWTFGDFFGLWRFVAANAGRAYSSVCETVAICSGEKQAEGSGSPDSSPSLVESTAQPAQCQGKLDAVTSSGSIKFDAGSAILALQSYPIMRSVAQIALDCANATIEVQGHTDAISTNEYNIKLSQLRAEAVVRFMVEAGVPPERLRSIGYGAARPLVANNTEESRIKNRRIQFVVLAASKSK